MTEPNNKKTQQLPKISIPKEVEEKAHCLYCKKELPSTEELICPHCGLPLRRRKRHRQNTSHGSQLTKIIIHQPGQADRRHYLSQQITTLGSHPDNTLCFDLPYISGHHAQIEFTENSHTLTDLNSTNGTRLNGQSLTPGQPQRLTDKDIIRLSDSWGNSVKLTYVAPVDFGWIPDVNRAKQSYQLTKEVSHIGRGFDAEIVLIHPAVSWFHAKLIRQTDNRYLLEDLSAHSHTFLNGLQLQQPQLLEQGDVIGIGPFNLIYQGQGQLSSFVAERNFNIETANLGKRVYGKNWLGLKDTSQSRQILQQVDLDINPREFVALVGGSGSGKST